MLGELRRIKSEPVGETELNRAKSHLRGSILMGLESTSARMSQLARQEMYFGRQMSADEVISGIDAVTPREVLALAAEMFGGPLSMTVLGRLEHLRSIPESLVA